MNLFLTSDTHFGHLNIIRYTNRPYKSLFHMDSSLIRNWNERVKPEDQVVFLGDWCFRNTSGGKTGEGTTNKAQCYIDQLNGKITFVRGNHDCFSLDVRLLTATGYKSFTEVQIGDLIPTFNIDVSKVEYKPIKKIIIQKVYKSYDFQYSGTTFSFTDNHKMLCIRYNQRKYIQTKLFKETAKELMARKTPFLVLPSSFPSGNLEYEIDDDWLRLYGWILTDGGIEKHGYITLYQSKEDNIIKINLLLDRLRLICRKKIRDRNITEILGKKLKKRPKPNIVFRFLSAESKLIRDKLCIKKKYEFPSWINLLSDRQASVLLEAIVSGDGTKTKYGTLVVWGRKDFLSNLMGFCVTHGFDADLILARGRGYYLSIHKQRLGFIGGVKYVRKDKVIDYNLPFFTWCVDVENHNIFIEKDGRSLVTGNSNNSLNTRIKSLVLTWGNQDIWCVHNPENYNPDYELNFCGHVHENWKFAKKGKSYLINVGVDTWNFRPVTIPEILKGLNEWKKQRGETE